MFRLTIQMIWGNSLCLYTVYNKIISRFLCWTNVCVFLCSVEQLCNIRWKEMHILVELIFLFFFSSIAFIYWYLLINFKWLVGKWIRHVIFVCSKCCLANRDKMCVCLFHFIIFFKYVLCFHLNTSRLNTELQNYILCPN